MSSENNKVLKLNSSAEMRAVRGPLVNCEQRDACYTSSKDKYYGLSPTVTVRPTAAKHVYT